MSSRSRSSPLSNESIGRVRLLSHRLTGGRPAPAGDAVRAMLAMQGQDLDGVLWSIALRAPGATLADVRASFDSGTIVRSWPLRGTLHVTAAEDLPWILTTFAQRVVDATASRRTGLGLDDRTVGRAREIATARLSGGNVLGRAELLEAFSASGVSTDGGRGYHLLFHLALTGVLCFGPFRGKEQAVVLVADWIKKRRRLDPDEALGELARRYFESHGPATVVDMANWAKISMADARRATDIGGRGLVHVRVDGTEYLLGAEAEQAWGKAQPAPGAACVLALPGFDEYVLGYKQRDAVLEPAFSDRIVPGGNGVFRPTIVADGRIVGIWRKVRKRQLVEVGAEPFHSLSREDRRAFAVAAEGYGRFLGSAVRVM